MEQLSLTEKYLNHGEQTALETNEMKNNPKAFQKQVRSILDKYYSISKSQRKELKNFKKTY